MNEQNRAQAIRDMAQWLRQQRLANAARIVLDAAEPVAFVASQLALFVRPFAPSGQWRLYVDALTEEDGWKALKRSIDEREC